MNQNEYIREQEIKKSNKKLKKKIDDLTQQFQDLNNDFCENQEIVVPQVEEIINEQIKELEEELKNQYNLSNKKQRLSLTEKLFSHFNFKAWRSEQKQIRTNPIQLKIRGIRLLDGFDCKELSSDYVTKADKILVPNFNDNGLHLIVQVWIINQKYQVIHKQLDWGLYAIIQLSISNWTSKQYFNDMQYYKLLICFKFRQETQIYVPFGKYEFI